MIERKEDGIQGQSFVDTMCETLSSTISCHTSYTQIASTLGVASERSDFLTYSSASTGLTQDPKTSALYQEISTRYYAECFPHFEAIALPKGYKPSHDAILEHGEPISLLSHFDFSNALLVLPVFAPLNHMAIFVINACPPGAASSSPLENNVILSRLYMAAQNCHSHALTHVLQATQSSLPKLSQRERQILTWISRGKSNSVIAEILGLSLHTVTGYIRNIYLKTQTNDRTSAAVYALSTGLLHEKSFSPRTKLGIAV